MPEIDLLIRGADPVDVAIDDGCIVAVGRELDVTARETVDASGLRVFPGAVDAHVHFNDPGRADWEGWATGTAAAAAGGTTCVVDMPLNAHPPTVDADAVRLKLAAAETSAVVDFAFWGGLVPGNVPRLSELAELGVIGFKAFMSPSGIDDFEMADDDTLAAGMDEAGKLGLPVAVHAERPDRLLNPSGSTWRDYAASRPVDAELAAIARAIELAEGARCSLHVVHVSSGDGVRLVSEARARGVEVTCETCPHYLVLDEDDLERIGAVAKCAPPLRPRAVVDDLRAEVERGAVDFLASDHSPSPPSMKAGDDPFAIWGGISGCQSLVALTLTEGLSHALVSERPAVRFGLSGKGRLEAGADADVVLVDETEWELRPDDLRYRHRQSPYVGRRLRGRAVRAWLRGRPIGEQRGRLVKPG